MRKKNQVIVFLSALLLTLFISKQVYAFSDLTAADTQFIRNSLKNKAAISYMESALAVSESLISTCILKNIQTWPSALYMGKFVAFMDCKNKENGHSTFLITGTNEGPYVGENYTNWPHAGIAFMFVQNISMRPHCKKVFIAYTDASGVISSKDIWTSNSGTCDGYKTAIAQLKIRE